MRYSHESEAQVDCVADTTPFQPRWINHKISMSLSRRVCQNYRCAHMCKCVRCTHHRLSVLHCDTAVILTAAKVCGPWSRQMRHRIGVCEDPPYIRHSFGEPLSHHFVANSGRAERPPEHHHTFARIASMSTNESATTAP